MNKKHEGARISFQPRIRKGAFFEASWDYGCRHFSVYNRTYISSTFSNPVEEYWHVTKHVGLWPVMGERQIEISGDDAPEFIQYLTCRDMSKCEIGQCKYALLLNSEAGIVCDPIILRLAEKKYWISTSDCDLELWIKGVHLNSGFRVEVKDANVSLLQIQGPKSSALVAKLFGEELLDLQYYRLRSVTFKGVELVISRTGWSGELGYEVYLSDFDKGSFIFNEIMEYGKEFSIATGSVNQARRIEAGILSWGVEMSQDETPYDVGLARLVEFGTRDNFIGRDLALKCSKREPIKTLAGFKIMSPELESNETPWKVFYMDKVIGKLTSLAFSPRLKFNIGFGLIQAQYANLGSKLFVEGYNKLHEAEIVKIPFMEKKQTANARELALKFNYSNKERNK